MGDEVIDVWLDGVAATNLHQGFEAPTLRVAEPNERRKIFAWWAADI